MGCYQTDAAVGAECQRTSAGSDVRACLCWYAESCCIKLSQGCFRWWWRGFHCNGTETPPFLFTASPPHVHVRYPLSFTCVSSSRHPAFLSGVQGWVSPRAPLLTRFLKTDPGFTPVSFLSPECFSEGWGGHTKDWGTWLVTAAVTNLTLGALRVTWRPTRAVVMSSLKSFSFRSCSAKNASGAALFMTHREWV